MFYNHRNHYYGSPLPENVPYSSDEEDELEYEARRKRQEFFHLATDSNARAEVMTFGLKSWILDTYNKVSLALQQTTYDTRNQVRVRGSLRGFVRNITQAMSYILVATKYSSIITLSTLALLQSASEDIVWNVEALYESARGVLTGLESMKNYFDFLDPEMTPSSTPRREPFVEYKEETGRGMRIVAKDVTFGYKGEQTVLKGLNFTIEPGELIAIVGGNGSGKSTLVKLLARFYDVSSGSIEINGHDIRQYDTDELWSHMSTVNQDFGTPSPSAADSRKVLQPNHRRKHRHRAYSLYRRHRRTNLRRHLRRCIRLHHRPPGLLRNNNDNGPSLFPPL